mgnify:CR=1 FL=1
MQYVAWFLARVGNSLLDVPERGARERLLEAEGSLGSSFLVAQALDTVGLVQGPHAWEPGSVGKGSA